MNIRERLFELQDKEYAAFQVRLTPGIPQELFIGVRVPLLRKLARELQGSPEAEEFLNNLPHTYYDENILHGCLLSGMKEYDRVMERLEEFLPFVDNWAVCDTMSPKVFKRNRERLIHKISQWCSSEHTYTCRFGMGMLMGHFLDEDFKEEYLELPAAIHREEYYVQMMQAWYYATALAKQWEATIPYIREGRLDRWVHNKTIQKARESYRITPEQKEYLKTLKR
ncbi:MAG: DNA alkylation repair protein [Lachnospiraceae bacterium]|nr:DNA alkylation repair protein [Lachnospiraceae bacterium]